ncbi:uncharacterized protein LOC124843247 [Vigna umbellata]|uniref:uncharacterized protein LOC124843247 n=1 Tax=Vigna umbellata TaxID=87088 RepID=UPI001F5EDE64|nr:uncharacterized protein LOC124843247 [Vigna umbellata]
MFDIPKDYNVLIERIQDTTTNIQKTRNTITIRDGEEKNSYISEPVADKYLENNAFKDTKNNLSLSTTIVNDKLLNGLLSSSFEEASCISRFQSYLYQKVSPYKPSKYLISKLRNYEHLHQSCGPYTTSYNETIKEGAKVSKNGVDSKCKYFIWTVEDGLGNRMISMVSAFLYAILTDRVLLVRFGDDMLNLFCEPFPNSSWLLPKNSPYWNDLKQFETHKIIFIDNKENNSRELLQPALVINLRHTHAGPTNRFHCDKNQHHLQKIPVLILQSNEYFVPTLYMVSSFREDFDKMFPDKDTIFHHLGRYLFQPSNVAWERIRNLYEEHLAKENERIGLQIRVFNTRQAPPQTVIDEIISCTHQNKLLPKFNMHNLRTLPLKDNTSKVVLVVSLYSKYGEGLKSLYQNNTTLSREVIKVYQPSHEEHQNSRNSMHNIKAWTDIYLLSLCNSLVTSTFSTFGYVASSLAGLKPLILKNVYGKKVPNPPCEQVKFANEFGLCELTQFRRGSVERNRIFGSGFRSRGFAGGAEEGSGNETVDYAFYLGVSQLGLRRGQRLKQNGAATHYGKNVSLTEREYLPPTQTLRFVAGKPHRMANVEKSFQSFRTLIVVASITFPILIIFYLTHQNPIFDIFQGIQNNTTNICDSVASAKNNTFEDEKNDEKLFGGLLVSSFNESSCVSRFRSYLYRKASPFKPSEYLIYKLRNYENLHRNCGPYTKSYNETMKDGANFSKSGVDSKCKYLVWTAIEGLGNRMISLVSTFLYAIFTDRVLLVRFDNDMMDLFCEPFPDSSWLLPKNSTYWNDLRQFKTWDSMFVNNKGNDPQTTLFLDLMNNNVRVTNRFHCDQNQVLLQNIPILILRSNEYFAPSLYLTYSFRQDFNKMFPDKDTTFHLLGRYLFHPSNVVWEHIQNVYEAHLAKENERIGLQIRIYNTRQTPEETIINETISCLQQNMLLPKFNMQNSSSPPLEKNTSKVVLVVSLYSKYGERLKSIYESNTSLSQEVIKVYQPSHEEHQNSGDNMHNIKAWSEIYLLGLCDALVTSPTSTFGYVAHSLGGMKPLVLQSISGKSIPKVPCQRLKYMEPCFHDPPNYDCMANATVDFTSIFHNLKRCEDQSRGMKIINT